MVEESSENGLSESQSVGEPDWRSHADQVGLVVELVSPNGAGGVGDRSGAPHTLDRYSDRLEGTSPDSLRGLVSNEQLPNSPER
jgi:hypothetical protein